MKKIFTLILIIAILFLGACDYEEELPHFESQALSVNHSLIGTKEFVIAKRDFYLLDKKRPHYLYYSGILVGNKMVYTVEVASNLDLEIGQSVEVYKIWLEYGFSYSVIHVGDGKLDTTYHKYLERI